MHLTTATPVFSYALTLFDIDDIDGQAGCSLSELNRLDASVIQVLGMDFLPEKYAGFYKGADLFQLIFTVV